MEAQGGRGRGTPGAAETLIAGDSDLSASPAGREVAKLAPRLIAAARPGADAPRTLLLEPLGGGRTDALVFKCASLFGADRRPQGPPVVIKVAPRARGAQERARYEAHARTLPASCRPDLLAYATSGAFAGLCFAYVGGPDNSPPETLTERLRHGGPASVELVLTRLFPPLKERWCAPSRIRPTPDVATDYLKRYFAPPRSVAAAEEALWDCAGRCFGARRRGRGGRIGDRTFPSPLSILLSPGVARAGHTCIVHGDLNSDNVLIAGGEAVMIDFEKTGRGHLFSDLIAIESSVRINCPTEPAGGDIMERERSIAASRPPADAYSAAIGAVRRTGLDLFGGLEGDVGYAVGATAIGLRLMLATDLSDAARAGICASTLWAAKRLAGEALD